MAQAGSYKNLEERTAPLPPFKAGEVLVKIHAVSLQYRDILNSCDAYPTSLQPELVPCSDMAGEVIALGSDVTGWNVGDRVCANFCTEHLHGDLTPANSQSALGGQAHGVLTQYKIFKPYSLVAIPTHLSYEEASTLPCAALTAYNALRGPRPVKAGDTVLVLGTGGVSIFGLQFAVASGATVIATSSSDAKLKQAAKYGAKHLINYSKTPEWEKEVLRITEGRGVDHVLEVGGAGTLERSMLSVRFGGYVHIIGVLAQSSTPAGTIPMTITRSINLRGIYIGPVSLFQDMLRLIKEHPEETRPVIDKVFPFAETIKAYEHLNSQAHVGKVVISLETI
ncbi:alcohol dehydrogenase superfamily protein [Mucidula mucida]|nr:alcohol dehydrogenase superfamily protein [Mucidula mucida]